MPRVTRHAPILNQTPVQEGIGGVLGRGLSDVGGALVEAGQEREKALAKARAEEQEAMLKAQQDQLDIIAKGEEEKKKFESKIAIAKGRAEISKLRREYSGDSNMGFRKDNNLLSTTIEDYNDLNERWESEITEGWSLEDKSSFMSGDITGKNIAFGSVIGKNDRLRGEQASEDYSEYLTERAKLLDPLNLDASVEAMRSEGLDFIDIGEAGELEDASIRLGIKDMLDNPDNIEQHPQIRESQTYKDLFTQNDHNKSVDFDERHAVATDADFEMDRLEFERVEGGRIKEMADSNAVLQDIENFYEDRGDSPTQVKAAVDFAKKFIPEGEDFTDSSLTSEERFEQLIVDKNVKEHMGDVKSKISFLKTLDVGTRDGREKIAVELKSAIDSLSNHGFLITLEGNRMGRTAALNQSFDNIEAKSDLMSFINTMKKDMDGKTIKPKNDDINIVKGLGRLADSYMHGSPSKTLDDMAEGQAISNRLKTIAIEEFISGNDIYAKTSAEFAQRMDEIEKAVIEDVAQNPDTYDRIIDDRTRGQFSVPENIALNMVTLNVLQSPSPRSESVNGFIGMGMTPEKAEILYDSVSPRAFNEISRLSNRTPEQVTLEGIVSDLDAISDEPDSATPKKPTYPLVQNKDGRVSNVMMGTFGFDGRSFALPTMVDGKQLTPDQAEAVARENGLQNYKSFDTDELAQDWIDQNHGSIDINGSLRIEPEGELHGFDVFSDPTRNNVDSEDLVQEGFIPIDTPPEALGSVKDAQVDTTQQILDNDAPPSLSLSAIANDPTTQLVVDEEGFSPTVQPDDKFEKGAVSAGYGHKLSASEKKKFKVGDTVSKDQALKWLQSDIDQARDDAESLVKDMTSLPLEVQDVLVSMAYQLGKPNMSTFKKTIKLLNKRPFTKEVANAVAKEMLDSDWAKKQTPARAKAQAKIVRESVK